MSAASLLSAGPAVAEEKSRPASSAEPKPTAQDYFADLIVADPDRTQASGKSNFSVMRLAGGNSLIRFTIRDKLYEEFRNKAGVTIHTRVSDRATQRLLQLRISDRFHANGETGRLIVHEFAASGAVSSEVTTFTADGDAVHRASIQSATGRWSTFRWNPETLEFAPVRRDGVDPQDIARFVWDQDRLKWRPVK